MTQDMTSSDSVIHNLGRNPRFMRHMIIAAACAIALLAVFFNETVYRHLFLGTTLVALTSVMSLKAVRLLPRLGDDLFDPCFLFVMFVIISVLPLAMIALLDPETIERDNNLLAINDLWLLSKAVAQNIILVPVCVLVYMVLCSRMPIGVDQDDLRSSRGVFQSNVWILLFIVFFAFVMLFKLATGALYTRSIGGSEDMVVAFRAGHGLLFQQIMINTSRFATLSSVIAFGIVVSCARTLARARVRLLIITLTVLSYSFILFASRGPAIIFLSAGAFADRVRWKGRLLNWRLFLVIFVGGWLAMHFLNLVESYVIRGVFSEQWQYKLLTSLEPQVVDNAGVIIRWVDDGDIRLQYGENYVTAAKSLIPTQIRGEGLQILSEWFVWKANPVHAEDGAGYNFSVIAEGYLNAKEAGVAIQAAVVGLVLAFIRYLKTTARLGPLGPALYACSMPLIYKLYRVDTTVFVKSTEWNIIILFFLIVLATMLITIKSRRTARFRLGPQRSVQLKP